MTVTAWHVTIGFDATLSEDAPFDLMEDLEEYGAVVSVTRAFNAGTISLAVEAGDVSAAVAESIRLVNKALKRHSATHDLTSIDVQTWTDFEAELDTPVIPEVVGYAEIAQMAGVSRQRARQFADIAGFPKPAIVTAQGPLMTKTSVTQWLDNRNASRRKRTPAHA